MTVLKPYILCTYTQTQAPVGRDPGVVTWHSHIQHLDMRARKQK